MKQYLFSAIVLAMSASTFANGLNDGEYSNSFKPKIEMKKFQEERDNKIETLIVNGETATLSEFPFYARIVITNYQNSYGHTCGGSIINNKYILTAAHCVDSEALAGNGFTKDNLGVVINNSNYNNVYLSDIKRVDDIYIHPQYDPVAVRNDIAILELEDPIREAFTPIKLPTEQDKLFYDQLPEFSVTGMGYINDFAGVPSHLMKTNVRAESDSQCESMVNAYYGSPFYKDEAICVTPIDSNGSCNGDSGGPLTYRDASGHQQQIGIVSYGSNRGCAINGVPSVYTEIYHYENWINAVLRDQVPDVDDNHDSDDDKSGGSLGFLSLLGLAGLSYSRRKKQQI